MLNIVVNPMLNKLAGGGNKGNQLIQVGGSFNSLMGTFVIILTGLLIPEIAKAQISQVFPLMYTALAIFAVAFLVVLFTDIPENAPKAVAKNEKSQYGPLSFRHFMLGAIAIFVYVGVEVGIPNVLQKWLNVALEADNATAIAATVAGTYWFLMLVGRLTGAALGAKVSAKTMLAVVFDRRSVSHFGCDIPRSFDHGQPPRIRRRQGLRDGRCSRECRAARIVRSLHGRDVGQHLQLAVEGLGKYTEKASGIFMALVCGGGILPLLQNGIVAGRRLSDKLLGDRGRFDLHALVRFGRFEER